LRAAAGSRADLDQSRLGQTEHALADRAARDPEEIRQLIHRVGLLGHEFAGGDAVPDRLGDGFGEGRRL
jgi:hypothetical protein